VIIKNKRTYKGPGVYIGRPSPLGNPFIVGKNGTRAVVIERYKHWLWSKISKPGFIGDYMIMRSLAALDEDSVLICWCYPKACHGSTIIAAWKWLKQEGLI